MVCHFYCKPNIEPVHWFCVYIRENPRLLTSVVATSDPSVTTVKTKGLEEATKKNQNIIPKTETTYL